MKRTTRCLSSPGPCCAPRWPLLRSTSRWAGCVLLWFAGLIALSPLRAAFALDAPDQSAVTALYISPGTSGHQAAPFVGSFNLNSVLGADRFYNAGFTGTAAVMANIEAGHIWTGHETLSHVQLIPTQSGALGEFDRHATWVGMVMGGRPTSSDPTNTYQRGLAPDAQLFSGAIALGWSGTRYTSGFFLSFSDLSTFGPYRAAMVDGLPSLDDIHRTADVINSSWVLDLGTSTRTGTDQVTGVLDALVNENPRTLVTWAAGNTLPSGAGPNRVLSAASGYNNIAVAALTPNGGAFDLPSAFSNGGPNDYSGGPTFVPEARQVIDIAAPGENFSTAYYGGQTGGNGPTLGGVPNGPVGGPDWYTRNVSGTSFAAPTVAGGAALLYDAAHTRLAATPDARDARVMKAVLMNSAAKTTGWNNGQVAHPNGNGGVLTTQGLDNRVGAGRMDLDRAFEQLLWGTNDVAGTGQGNLGVVDRIGWDFGLVAQGTDNDYLIGPILPAGSRINATLDWFRDRIIVSQTSYNDVSYDNLDLQLWEAIGGVATNLIAESKSLYNNAEHFSFLLPRTSQYLLRVQWTSELFDFIGDTNSEHYGLAWFVAVPEPGTLALLLVAILSLATTRRRS